MSVKKAALFAVAFVAAVAVSGIALAAPVGGPSPPQVETGAVSQAIFRAAWFVLPVLGALEIVRAILLILKAVHDGFSGREAVRARLLNIGVALVLVAVPLTGVWVPLANALLAVVGGVLQSIEKAVQNLQ